MPTTQGHVCINKFCADYTLTSFKQKYYFDGTAYIVVKKILTGEIHTQIKMNLNNIGSFLPLWCFVQCSIRTFLQQLTFSNAALYPSKKNMKLYFCLQTKLHFVSNNKKIYKGNIGRKKESRLVENIIAGIFIYSNKGSKMTAHYVSQLDHRGSKSKRVFHSTGYLLPRSHQREKKTLYVILS